MANGNVEATVKFDGQAWMVSKTTNKKPAPSLETSDHVAAANHIVFLTKENPKGGITYTNAWNMVNDARNAYQHPKRQPSYQHEMRA
jgi:hypothetical protein